MRIVDAQIHLWGSGLPSNMAQRQVTSFITEEAVGLMDEGGGDAAVIHPPALVEKWRNQPGMLGLRYGFLAEPMRGWLADGTLDIGCGTPPSGPVCRSPCWRRTR